MTAGYLCDGGCGSFFTGKPAGEYHYFHFADDGRRYQEPRTAHYCHDCADQLATTFGLVRDDEPDELDTDTEAPF